MRLIPVPLARGSQRRQVMCGDLQEWVGITQIPKNSRDYGQIGAEACDH